MNGLLDDLALLLVETIVVARTWRLMCISQGATLRIILPLGSCSFRLGCLRAPDGTGLEASDGAAISL